jgi:uncharacterized protein YkwD
LEAAVPVRALFSSFLLAVMLATTVAAVPAAASTPTAKIALGAKKKATKTQTAAAKKKALAKKKAAAKKKALAKKRAAAKTSTAKRAAQPAAPAAPAAECANTTLAPDAANLELIRAALVCLHNQVRAQNGLVTLAANNALAVAAAGHSDDMVARGYFEHNTPEGGTFDKRVLAAGYAANGEGWNLGENLIWGTGELATPAGMMRAWMNSEHHRENILNGDYRELGFGIQLGTPTGSADGVTITAEFGVRI